MRPLAALALAAVCSIAVAVSAADGAAAPPPAASSSAPPAPPAPGKPADPGTKANPGAPKKPANPGKKANPAGPKKPAAKAPAPVKAGARTPKGRAKARGPARSHRRQPPAKTRGGPARKPKVVFDQQWAATPSARYGALDRDACHAELRARGVAFTVVAEARGVEAPVRLPGDVAGVVWRTELPASERAHAPWDVVDCRVVLSLHDWSPRLRGRGITEVLLFSAWRPPPATWPKDQPATRHPGALAIDVKRMIREPDPVTGAPRKDLDVDRDWDPRLGAPICGPDAPPPSPATPEAAELRAIACEADDARLFTVVLTPHYDRAHHNHLHLEITPDVTWRLTR